MQLTLTTKIDIPQSIMEGVLTTAADGGVSYWAAGSTKRRDDLTVFEATIWDIENPHERFVLDADKMRLGVERLHASIMAGDVHPGSEIGGQFLRHLFADQEVDGLDMVDAVCADAIVQMACFGEIVFG